MKTSAGYKEKAAPLGDHEVTGLDYISPAFLQFLHDKECETGCALSWYKCKLWG